MNSCGAIGIFDSGYGGLTILESIRNILPSYDYIYLGDNARTPYGTRSFEVVYEYTLQAVQQLFEMGCPLIILACNTASAKALRNIQQKDLLVIAPNNRILGVIRPTTEEIGNYTKTSHVGILGTNGTIRSNSYKIEIEKFFPEISVTQKSCPMLVPLIENNEYHTNGGDYFIEKYTKEILTQDPRIDTLILACTHYPIIEDQIRKHIPDHVKIFTQGDLVANKLKEYLDRHPEIECRLLKGNSLYVYTTGNSDMFNSNAAIFYSEKIDSKSIKLI